MTVNMTPRGDHWKPARWHRAPVGVPESDIARFEETNKRGWQEWMDDYYPGFKVEELRCLGIRDTIDIDPNRQDIEWAITVRSPKGKTRSWMHGEGAAGGDIAPTDEELFTEMEADHDFGTVNETLVEDMDYYFKVEPKELSDRGQLQVVNER